MADDNAAAAEYIKLKVVGQNTNEVDVRVKNGTLMGKLKKSYADRTGVAITQLRFRFDGHWINDDDTPESLEMEEDDVIEVMLTGLPNLSQSSLDMVYNFLDEPTLRQLREVSSEIKAQAELFILRTQETVVNNFEVYPNIKENKTTISCTTRNQRDFIIWKCCWQTLLNRLDMDQSLLTINKPSLVVTATSDKLEKLLELMKPLIQKSKFLSFFVRHNESEIVRICSSFLEKKHVPSIHISVLELREVRPEFYIQFIKLLTPNQVYCNLPRAKGSVDLVLKLADFVKSLTIGMELNDIVSVVRGILSRKCEKLYLSNNEKLFYVTDMEKLIQEPVQSSADNLRNTDILYCGQFHSGLAKILNYLFCPISPFAYCIIVVEEMDIALTSLPSSALDKICDFLYATSLLRLREVSKVAKVLADISILRTQETTIDDFGVYPKKNKTTISFSSRNQRDFNIWKCGCQALLNRLDLHRSILTVKNLRLEIAMTLEEMQKILELMKRYAQKSRVFHIYLGKSRTKILQMCSSFLEKKHVHSVYISLLALSKVKCPDSYIKFVKCLTPYGVECDLPSTKGSVDFVLKLADIVKSLSIRLKGCDNFSVVRGILSRKCERLALSHMEKLFTGSDLEKLIQVLTNSGKKCEFSTWTNAPPMESQIGVYKVKITEHGYTKYLKITHLNMI